MTQDEIKHINWMYNRLTSVHKENLNLDYMTKFKSIIDEQLRLCGVGVTLVCDVCKSRRIEQDEKWEDNKCLNCGKIWTN